jgi:TetR/AcrR family fatty acid metabolism transcriptional regulator
MPKQPSDGPKRPSFIEEARRAQLIACAIETIATLGYAQASLAHIAERAGISKSAIAYYFSSKEELIAQVGKEILTDAAHVIGPQIAAQPTPRLRLHAYLQAHVMYIHSHLQYMMAIMEIASNARALSYAATAQRPVLKALEAMLRNGQEAGEFREFDPHVMAVTIRAAIDRLSPLFMAEPDLDPEAYAGELVDLFDRATRKEDIP